MSAYDTNAPAWGATAETWWKFYEARPFLAGGFAWTGFDYRGEPTPYGFPCISSHFGILDTCGFPKDSYYYYKAWWGTEPVLHLYPHWNWPGRSGEPIDVWVQTNLDEVELFLNGASQGLRRVERLGHVQWSVPYAHGYIEARGTKSGKVVLTERRETTSKPTQLKLAADRSTVKADGQDLAVLSVQVLDEKGRLVPIAKNLIQFEISGEGAILGVGNGDSQLS
jgi:beta-galactosidase